MFSGLTLFYVSLRCCCLFKWYLLFVIVLCVPVLDFLRFVIVVCVCWLDN